MDAGDPDEGRLRGHSNGPRRRDDKKYHPTRTSMEREDHYGDMDFKVAGNRAGTSRRCRWTSKVMGISIG